MIQNVKFTKIGNNCNIVIRESVLNERGNVKAVIGKLCATEHSLNTFQEFMDVLFTFKKRALAMR
jgi:hypothetical protein